MLFASAIQQVTDFCPVKELSGVTVSNAKPSVSFKDFCTGTMQSQTEAYLRQHCGFREPLTRLYNQTVWAFFRYSKVAEAYRILINDDNWIYEPWSVEEYYQSLVYVYANDSADMVGKMEAEARRLRQLRQILEPNGTHLFVALLPGKEQVYGEHVPKNTRYFKEKKTTAYEFYSKRFKELGVEHVNFADWFLQLKGTTSYPLFPQTGTHWSNLASMHVADSLLRYLEDLGDMNLMNLEIGSTYKRTVKPDNDLESLMNLIWPLQKASNFLAGCRFTTDTTVVKPKIITIGDSFYWNIINLSSFASAFHSCPYWYYFSTAFFNDEDLTVDKKVSDLDVLQEVLDADFVMLSYSTATLYGMSSGFSQRLLLELCYEPEEIDAKLGKVRKAIQNDSARMAEIHAHAWPRGRNYEQALSDEVNLEVFNDLEHYFPALLDSIPTRRSLKARALTGDSLAFVELEVRKTIENLKASPKQMDIQREKAQKRGLDLETMTRYDAQWVVNEKLKKGLLTFPGKLKKNMNQSS